MPKVYLVEKTISAYVRADSEEEARGVRVHEFGADVRVTVEGVTALADVPEHWRNVIPFRDRDRERRHDDHTIEQLLSR